MAVSEIREGCNRYLCMDAAPTPGISLDGDAKRKYARFLLIEGGFAVEDADALLAGGGDGSAERVRRAEYLTQREAADALGCTTRHVRQLVKDGELAVAFNDGRRPRYDASEVLGYFEHKRRTRAHQIIKNTRNIHDAAA